MSILFGGGLIVYFLLQCLVHLTVGTAKYLLWNRANNSNEKHHDLKFTPRFTHPDILFEIHPRQFSTELVKRSCTSGTINDDKPYHVEAVIIHQQDFILLFEIKLNGLFYLLLVTCRDGCRLLSKRQLRCS